MDRCRRCDGLLRYERVAFEGVELWFCINCGDRIDTIIVRHRYQRRTQVMNQHVERLDGLAPFLRQPAQRLIALCDEKLKRSLLVVRGWSSVQDQLALYKKGRAYDAASGMWLVVNSMDLVTKALPGASAHNVITNDGAPFSLALDVVPLKYDGTADWAVEEKFWDDLYEIAWRCGLDPLGDAVGAYLQNDKGHFEEPAWRFKLEGLGAFQPSVILGGGTT